MKIERGARSSRREMSCVHHLLRHGANFVGGIEGHIANRMCSGTTRTPVLVKTGFFACRCPFFNVIEFIGSKKVNALFVRSVINTRRRAHLIDGYQILFHDFFG